MPRVYDLGLRVEGKSHRILGPWASVSGFSPRPHPEPKRVAIIAV